MANTFMQQVFFDSPGGAVLDKARGFFGIFEHLTQTAQYQLIDTKTGSDFTAPGDNLADGDWYVIQSPIGAPFDWQVKVVFDTSLGMKMTFAPFGQFNDSTDVFTTPTTTDDAIEFEIANDTKISVISNFKRFIVWSEPLDLCYVGAINSFEAPSDDTNPGVIWAGKFESDVNIGTTPDGIFYNWRRISPVDNTTELVLGGVYNLVDTQANTFPINDVNSVVSPFDSSQQPHKASNKHTNIDGLVGFSDINHQHIAGQLVGFGLGSKAIDRESGPPGLHTRLILNGVAISWTGAQVQP